jgi:hypothetical protein
MHTPQMPAPTQSAAHGAPSLNLPSVLHVCGMLPLHCFVPGTHEPAHTPLLQTKGQTAPLFAHLPFEPQV